MFLGIVLLFDGGLLALGNVRDPFVTIPLQGGRRSFPLLREPPQSPLQRIPPTCP
jgi:hypothetical protein